MTRWCERSQWHACTAFDMSSQANSLKDGMTKPQAASRLLLGHCKMPVWLFVWTEPG